jgi:hypothetical protein
MRETAKIRHSNRGLLSLLITCPGSSISGMLDRPCHGPSGYRVSVERGVLIAFAQVGGSVEMAARE